MTTRQDLSAVIAAAKAHTKSYIDILLSPTSQDNEKRATLMGSYYLSNLVAFSAGSILPVNDQGTVVAVIKDTLDKLDIHQGTPLVLREYRVEGVAEASAIVSIVFDKGAITWTNIYFFRILENGEKGYEGGIFDGEVWVLKQLKQ